MTDKQTPSAGRPADPDPDAEQEVDLGRLARVILQRWWLPVGGLILGLAIGYVLSLGGAQVYRAEALVSLGSPFTPSGNPLVNLTSNPRKISEIINSAAAQRNAARAAHLKPTDLAGKVALRTVSSGLPAKATGGPQLVGISVNGARPKRVADAANRLAALVIAGTGGYVKGEIVGYENQLKTQDAQLASLNTRIKALQLQVNAPGLAPLDRLVLVSYLDNAEQRRGTLLDSQATSQQQLLLAHQVETPSILEPAVAVKTTGRSRHNSMAVGGLVGLILGLLAALLWDWGSMRVGRRPAAA